VHFDQTARITAGIQAADTHEHTHANTFKPLMPGSQASAHEFGETAGSVSALNFQRVGTSAMKVSRVLQHHIRHERTKFSTYFYRTGAGSLEVER